MLVLTRKPDESVLINGQIEVTVVAVRGNKVRLGFRAPLTVSITRSEAYHQRMSAEPQPPPPASAHDERVDRMRRRKEVMHSLRPS